MPHDQRADLKAARLLYARMMAAASGSLDPRLEAAFDAVPREDFLGPGPWRIMAVGHGYVETPTADPIHLYQDVLVALDAERGINNGAPSLHARWIGAVAPARGAAVCHIGAGTGYYSALLSLLVRPGGSVMACEIDPHLAFEARKNLQSFEGVEVIETDATALTPPPSDIVYVNAGVVAPPLAWLEALKPGGRLIFPWRPTQEVGLAVLVTRVPAGYAAKVLGPAWFIPCIGASDPAQCLKSPTIPQARAIGALWPTAQRAPDASAVAIFEDLWFSSAPVETPL